MTSGISPNNAFFFFRSVNFFLFFLAGTIQNTKRKEKESWVYWVQSVPKKVVLYLYLLLTVQVNHYFFLHKSKINKKKYENFGLCNKPFTLACLQVGELSLGVIWSNDALNRGQRSICALTRDLTNL